MKTLTKILAMALTFIMVLSLATAAFAANVAQSGPFTVTVKNATGHSYKIYQIFTADLALDGENEVLSNIKYGADYLPNGVTTDTEVPEDVLKAVNENPNTITPTGEGTEMTTAGDTATITVKKAGYYMIVDVTDSLPDQDTRSAVMFQVVGDTNITSKHTGTTIVKKVQDINDSTGEQPKDGDSVWIDSADYDIGDTVPFKSTANFEGLDNYTSYKVVITDIMAKGLTYNKDMTISINGTLVTEGFVIEATENYVNAENDKDEYNGGTMITVTFDNLKTIVTDSNSAEIVLNYTAELNSGANLGASGNPNKIKATTKPDGTGDTPWDVNIVFTYKLEANKYANEVKAGNELTGAGFTLYKEVKDSTTEGAKTGAAIKADFADNIKAKALDDAKYYVLACEVKTDAAGDTFGFEGVDDGNYVLVETKIPDGYNAWDAVAFTITAAHDVEADDPQLTSLTGGDLATGEFTETGIIDTNIINNSGVELPETGGIGTTIFYVLGGLLVVAAVVLLVTKKRMSSAE